MPERSPPSVKQLQQQYSIGRDTVLRAIDIAEKALSSLCPDAIASGAAAVREPWKHYDLGHGYCTYTFFEQCPRRMACARLLIAIPMPVPLSAVSGAA